MLMKDFRRSISPNAILEIKSYHTRESIKECRAVDLYEDDLNLVIASIHASVYFDDKQKVYLGKFVLYVTEE